MYMYILCFRNPIYSIDYIKYLLLEKTMRPIFRAIQNVD